MNICPVNKVIQVSDLEEVELFQVTSCLESIGIKLGTDGPWIAGGSVIKSIQSSGDGLGDSDIDMYFPLKGTCDEYAEKLEANSKKVRETEWSESFEFPVEYGEKETMYKVQVIYPSQFRNDVNENEPIELQKIIGSFDLDICQIAYDGENICWINSSLNQIQNRKMKLFSENVKFPRITFNRIIKYTRRGFSLDKDSMNSFFDKFVPLTEFEKNYKTSY